MIDYSWKDVDKYPLIEKDAKGPWFNILVDDLIVVEIPTNEGPFLAVAMISEYLTLVDSVGDDIGYLVYDVKRWKRL